MPPHPKRVEGKADGHMWVINEGISFVQGFDHDHSALIMTVLPREAKFFGSPEEAELWVLRYGADLDSYRILLDEQFLGSGSRFDSRAPSEAWRR